MNDIKTSNKTDEFIILGTEVEYIAILGDYNKIDNLSKLHASKNVYIDLIKCISKKYLCVDEPIDPMSNLNTTNNGFILQNGGRIYIDSPFLEYSTPECNSAHQVT